MVGMEEQFSAPTPTVGREIAVLPNRVVVEIDALVVAIADCRGPAGWPRIAAVLAAALWAPSRLWGISTDSGSTAFSEVLVLAPARLARAFPAMSRRTTATVMMSRRLEPMGLRDRVAALAPKRAVRRCASRP
ncbi:hypothetical protein [Streptomyces sp. 900105245]